MVEIVARVLVKSKGSKTNNPDFFIKLAEKIIAAQQETGMLDLEINPWDEDGDDKQLGFELGYD